MHMGAGALISRGLLQGLDDARFKRCVHSEYTSGGAAGKGPGLRAFALQWCKTIPNLQAGHVPMCNTSTIVQQQARRLVCATGTTIDGCCSKVLLTGRLRAEDALKGFGTAACCCTCS